MLAADVYTLLLSLPGLPNSVFSLLFFIFIFFAVYWAALLEFINSFQPTESPTDLTGIGVSDRRRDYIDAYLSKEIPTGDTFLFRPALKFSGSAIASTIMVQKYRRLYESRKYLIARWLVYVLQFPSIAITNTYILTKAVQAVSEGFTLQTVWIAPLLMFAWMLHYVTMKFICVLVSTSGTDKISFNERRYYLMMSISIIWFVLTLLDGLSIFL